MTDDELLREIVRLDRAARSHRRLAHAAFLLAGLGFGSAAYLARTRFEALRAAGRFTTLGLLVAATVAVFLLASFGEGEGRKLQEQADALRRDLYRRRDPRRGGT
jgi:hypothetical protein